MVLKIKSEQIRLFQPEAEAAFVREVMEYLRENHAAQEVETPRGKTTVRALPDAALREMVEDGIRRGRDYRIDWRSTLISFVVLLFVGAPNFDEHPKVSGFFVGAETVDDAALESLLDEMTDEDWDEVENNYDSQAWNLMFKEEENV
jgi:hypothetical protein